MVSGVIDQHPAKYKSNKKGGGFFSTSSPQQAPPPPPPQLSAVAVHHNNKRFAESDLRPWPPMYGGRSQRYPTPDEQQHHHHHHQQHNNNNHNANGHQHPHHHAKQHNTSNAQHNNNFRSLSAQKLNGSNNGASAPSHYKNNTHKVPSSAAAAAAAAAGIYERNKYNFNMGKSSISSSMASSLASSAGGHSNNGGGGGGGGGSQDYYMLSQPYVSNSLAPSEGSVYASRDSNLLMKEREKNRFRKLRFASMMARRLGLRTRVHAANRYARTQWYRFKCSLFWLRALYTICLTDLVQLVRQLCGAHRTTVPELVALGARVPCL